MQFEYLIKARLLITERNLRLTRDHLRMMLTQTEEDVPQDWEKLLDTVRFVGMRLGDACIEVLSESQRRMTTQDIVDSLNNGQFRFRTSAPLREVNAALLRQPDIKKDGDGWIYIKLIAGKRGAPSR